MKCPNCKLPFLEEKDGKVCCSVCGWLEKVGKEWQSCDAPESQPPQESAGSQTQEPESPQEPDLPAEPGGPQPPEPGGPQPPEPVGLQPPEPEPKVKKYLGGIITVTEVDE